LTEWVKEQEARAFVLINKHIEIDVRILRKKTPEFAQRGGRGCASGLTERRTLSGIVVGGKLTRDRAGKKKKKRLRKRIVENKLCFQIFNKKNKAKGKSFNWKVSSEREKKKMCKLGVEFRVRGMTD